MSSVAVASGAYGFGGSAEAVVGTGNAPLVTSLGEVLPEGTAEEAEDPGLSAVRREPTYVPMLSERMER